MLTLLTATGCRPQAWAICERLMMAQTYAGPVRWIVVDDGETPQPIAFKRDGWTLEVIRRKPYWQKGQNTQAQNLLTGLAHVSTDDRLVLIEDDDWYTPDYLEVISRALEKADLVGETMARYYNVETRTGRQLNNALHASLCSTAMKGPAIEAFRRECKPGVQFIDMSLWCNFKGTKLLQNWQRVVGIKGLPGRGGIGMGHKRTFTGTADRDGALLRKWVGKDAELYL